jgi:hypothetical protein
MSENGLIRARAEVFLVSTSDKLLYDSHILLFNK